MVKVDISHRTLEHFVGKRITHDELEALLFTLGYELENVDGDVWTVDITADRPDLVSTAGIARLLKSYLGLASGLPNYTVKKNDYRVVINPNVQHVRPYTVAAVVKGLQLTEDSLKEIIGIQEKLHATFGRQRKKVAIGIYPLDKIIWPISYFAEDPKKISFIPLDFEKQLRADEILEQHPTGVTYKHLLADMQLYPFFMDAKKQVLSMPPIINSQHLGKVTPQTRDIFIECSGHDFHAQNIILNILVALLADMGGTLYAVTLEYGPKKLITPYLVAEKMAVPLALFERILGIILTHGPLKELLGKMQYGLEKIDDKHIYVLIPAFRGDIWHPVDVVDDVVRAYGINKLELSKKPVATTGGTTKRVQTEEQIADLLIGLDMLQTFTFALTTRVDQFTKMNLPQQEHISLGKTADESANMIRCWLLPELMKLLYHNKSRSYPQKLFEINFVVEPDEHADVRSRNVLKFSGVLCDEKVSFTDARQTVEYVLDRLNVGYAWQETEHSSFIPGRVAKLVVDSKEIGFCGEVHPQVLENWGLQLPVIGFELDLDKLFPF